MTAAVESGLLAGRVPYLRAGAGPREAVVLPGATALFRRPGPPPDAHRQARLVARLLPGYRFTILGYAASGYDAIVADAVAAIGDAPDAILGISFGGFVAMRLAAEHPKLVRRLILLVSAHRFSPEGRRLMDRQFDALERGDLPALFRENALLFRRPWYNALVRLKLWKDRHRLASQFRDPTAILHDYRQLFGPAFADNASHARRIVCPSLVIGGAADCYFDPAAFRETRDFIPGSELCLFDRETHMLPIERGQEVAAAVARFLARS